MQSGIIDNHSRILADEIAKIAPHCESIDIAVGYFFFSGFEEIKDLIKDIPIRILVGMELDPKVISELGKNYSAFYVHHLHHGYHSLQSYFPF